MLETYFDESAPGRRADDSLLIVAGYVGEEERWRIFEARWRIVLKEFRVSDFHMKNIRNLRHPSFRHLSAQQRRDLVLELIGAVSEAALLGSLVYLRPAEYEAVADSAFRSRYGSAYAMLVSLNLQQISRHLEGVEGFPHRTSVFIEDGHANARDALRVLANWKADTEPAPSEFEGFEVTTVKADVRRTSVLRIGEYGLGPKTTMYPLHAADMLAYLANSALSFKIDDFLRGLFDDLLPPIPHLSTYWDEAGLQEIVDAGRAFESENAAIRGNLHDMSQLLRRHNVKMRVLPWGYTIDGRHLSEEEWANARESIKNEFVQSRQRRSRSE